MVNKFKFGHVCNHCCLREASSPTICNPKLYSSAYNGCKNHWDNIWAHNPVSFICTVSSRQQIGCEFFRLSNVLMKYEWMSGLNVVAYRSRRDVGLPFYSGHFVHPWNICVVVLHFDCRGRWSWIMLCNQQTCCNRQTNWPKKRNNDCWSRRQ